MPPSGTGGPNHYDRLIGTFQVQRLTPEADTLFSYRITGFTAQPENPRLTIFEGIDVHGDDLGLIRLGRDGQLLFQVHLPIFGAEYDFSPLYVRPSDYVVENDKLLFRGLLIRPPLEPPPYGNPGLAIWADPES